MAKRTNILQTIEREINNGKTYLDKDGFFVTEEQVKKDKKEAYLNALKNDASLIEKGVTLAEFEKTYANDFIPASEVFEAIVKAHFPNQSLFFKAVEEVPVTNKEIPEKKIETKKANK